MWHIYATLDEVVVRIEPGYQKLEDAEKDTSAIFTRKKILWARFEDGQYGEPNTWRAFDATRCRWCHCTPNSAYTNFVEGRLVNT